MPFLTCLASVRNISHHLQLRILIQKLPSIILSLVCDLSLPRMNLPGPMFWVWLERRNLVRIVMSSHMHLNETLFNVLFTEISIPLHIVLMHSSTSSRTAVIISCIEAVAGTIFFSVLISVIREIISLIYSLSIIEICFNGGRRPWKGLEPPVCLDLCQKACPTALRPPVSLIIRLNEALRLLDVLLTTQLIIHVVDEKLLLQVNHLRAVHLIRHTAL